MKLIRSISVFVALMICSMALGFIAHYFYLASSDSNLLELLPGFYIMNTLLGVIIGALIIYLSQDRAELSGFTFMGGSLLKFAVFFLLFFPSLSDDPDIRKSEFVAFFLPYALSMLVEVWYLIRLLGRDS